MRRPLKLLGPIIVVFALILVTALFVLIFVRVDETVDANGFTEPADYVRAKPEIGGIIETVLVREGDEVNQGDTLVILQGDEIRLQVEQSCQNLLEAQARLAELEEEYQNLLFSESFEIGITLASLLDAQRRAEEAKRQYDRTEQLYNKGAVSLEERDQARLNCELSESLYETLKSRLNLLQSRYLRQIEERQKRVNLAEQVYELAQLRLQKTIVRAPIWGRMLTPNLDQLTGTKVSEGQAILEIGDPTEMNFIAKLDEIHVPDVQIGHDVRLFINAFPHRRYKVFAGEVISISQKPEIIQNGIVFEAKIRVREPWISLSPSKVYLKPGLSGKAKIITKHNVSLIETVLGLGEK